MHLQALRGILIASLFLFNLASAQNYPVHLTTQLVPPFSGYLQDYGNAGEEKLKLLVLFNDFTKPSYNIKLKISIQGQGISIQSKSYYFAGPFTLQPGVPLEISGSELFSLLNSQNLDFSGINKSQYEQRKILPEGFYTFCITAYDYNNPVAIQVSNASCAQAWLMLSDPPFLNLPQCGSTVNTMNPQQLTFSFTQMNMGSPNSAANTEFIFELWEIRPSGAIANNIVQTVPPIYSYTTNLTAVNYGIAEPPLVPGMQYAWRVRAVDVTGKDYFKNQGYSQVCTFTYGNLLDGSGIDLNLHGQGVSQRQIKLWWDSLATFSSYKIEFRKTGTENWFPVTTANSHLRIFDLEPSTSYEVHIQGIRDEYTTPFSQSIAVSTLPTPGYQCGELPVNPFNAQFQPLISANASMIWQVGQFEMNISQLQNMASPVGMYSGTGTINMPFSYTVPVSFSNIVVNSDQAVVQGKIVALTQGVDAWVNEHGVGTIQDGTAEPEIQINTSLGTGDFSVNSSNGTFVVNGTTYTYSPNGATVQDSNGNIFVVTNGGQVINAGTAGSGHGAVPENRNVINTSNGKILFKANSIQLYGLDEYKYPELINYYLTVKNASDNSHQPVNWKSVMEQKYDVIDIEYQPTAQLKADSIVFVTGTGTTYKPQGSGTNRKLYIAGGKHGDVQELFACYKTGKDSLVNIAKLNIVSYRQEQNRVTLIPLGNGINIDKAQIQNQLNEIYKPGIATWTVELAPTITAGDTLWDKDTNGRLNTGSNLFNRYSMELRAINKYIRSQNYYHSNEYFLVVTNKPVDSLNTEIQGEMPRGRNIGYLFTANPTARLIAHELGHGAFALEHSFEGNATLSKGGSDCLMDYTSGTTLYKGKYWDYIHNPTIIIGALEEDDQMQSKDEQVRNINHWLAEIKEACKMNTTITLGAGTYTFSAADMYVAGIHYDYLNIVITSPKAQSVNPKSRVTLGTINHFGVTTGKLPCVDVCEGLVKIDVPQDKVTLIKAYLEGGITLHNLLLFVNGYRSNAPNLDEIPKGTDEVNELDLHNYWSGIDAQFINRTGTRNVWYADGHHSVATSNHKDQGSFILNLSQWTCASNIMVSALLGSYGPLLKMYPVQNCFGYYHDATKFKLHTVPNASGFNLRRTNGKKAGNDILAKITSGRITFDVENDKLDIVCHSMGYAYALGIIDAIKQSDMKIKMGRFYIIAPENPKGATLNKADFEEVWQYGSNDKTGDKNQVWDLDGVAPQSLISGLTDNERAYIPDDGSVPKGFLESHYIANYWWLFNLQPGVKGYVKARN